MRPSLRLLVLEDSAADAELVVHALTAHGYDCSWTRVDTADGFEAALDAELDVIIADYSLPAYTAKCALLTAAHRQIDVPFIVVTGATGEEKAVECLRLGALDYLLKDRLARLPDAVDRALEARRLREERRVAERDLRAAAQILEHLPSLVIVSNAGGEIVYCSPSAERLLGFSRADLLGTGWWTLTRPTRRDAELARERISRAATHGCEKDPYEGMLLDAFGRSRWFEWRQEAGPDSTLIGIGHDVTLRKRAEEDNRALMRDVERSEKKYRALVDQTPAVTYTVDLERHEVFISRQVERLLGVPAAELMASPDGWMQLIHPDDRDAFGSRARAVASGSPPEVLRYRVLHRAGHAVWVRDEAMVIRDKDDCVVCLQGIVVDITDRVEAEQAVRDTAAALRTLIDASPLAIIEVDVDRRVKTWNLAAEEMFGWTAAEVVGQPNPILTDDAFGEYFAALEQLFAGHRVSYETRRQRKDGRLIDVMVAAAPIRNAEGQVTSIVGMIKDISERLRAQQMVKEREEYFRSLIEYATDVITVVDTDGRITYVSPSTQAVMGRSPEESIGESAFKWLHPDDAPVAAELFRSAMSGAKVDTTFVLRVQHADGSWRTLESVASLNQPGRVIINSRDVTERRALEEQLRQAQKMQAIGQLAGGVAHDFNNLLTAILGYGHLMRMQLPEESTLVADLDEIINAGERAGRLTRQLLAFSRKQTLSPRHISLTTLVQDFEKMLRRVIGEDVHLQTRLDPSLPPAHADPGQIEQVLLNLAVNARDAMPRGGSLVIETRRFSNEHPLVRGQARVEPGCWVTISVTDTGVGMPHEMLPRIFEPFFTTKEAGRGTGLGLATVYGIVTQSHGHIAVESEPGKGSTFTVFLPEARAAAALERGSSSDDRETRGTETILLAEDEPGIRKLMQSTLQQRGYTVLAAADGAEAMELASGHEGTIDLLVSDIVMPGINGVDLAQHLLGVLPTLKVMHISGYPLGAHVQKLKPSVTLLQKPFTPGALARAVRACLESQPDAEVA